MARGGARVRSGPPKDPNSARSERAGYVPTALPAEGYDGPIPEFPLPARPVYALDTVDGEKVRTLDSAETARITAREIEVWEWAWRTPQACMWSQPSESWRIMLVAMWARTFVVCESGEARAADKNSLHRFSDEIGFSYGGMRALGWTIAPDEVGVKRAESGQSVPAKKSSRRRMKVVSGGG